MAAYDSERQGDIHSWKKRIQCLKSYRRPMLIGMVDSMQPAISYCKGAGLHRRVWALERRVLLAAAILSLSVCFMLRHFGAFVVPLFVKSGETELLTLSIQAITYIYSRRKLFRNRICPLSVLV